VKAHIDQLEATKQIKLAAAIFHFEKASRQVSSLSRASRILKMSRFVSMRTNRSPDGNTQTILRNAASLESISQQITPTDLGPVLATTFLERAGQGVQIRHQVDGADRRLLAETCEVHSEAAEAQQLFDDVKTRLLALLKENVESKTNNLDALADSVETELENAWNGIQNLTNELRGIMAQLAQKTELVEWQQARMAKQEVDNFLPQAELAKSSWPQEWRLLLSDLFKRIKEEHQVEFHAYIWNGSQLTSEGVEERGTEFSRKKPAVIDYENDFKPRLDYAKQEAAGKPGMAERDLIDSVFDTFLNITQEGKEIQEQKKSIEIFNIADHADSNFNADLMLTLLQKAAKARGVKLMKAGPFFREQINKQFPDGARVATITLPVGEKYLSVVKWDENSERAKRGLHALVKLIHDAAQGRPVNIWLGISRSGWYYDPYHVAGEIDSWARLVGQEFNFVKGISLDRNCMPESDENVSRMINNAIAFGGTSRITRWDSYLGLLPKSESFERQLENPINTAKLLRKLAASGFSSISIDFGNTSIDEQDAFDFWVERAADFAREARRAGTNKVYLLLQGEDDLKRESNFNFFNRAELDKATRKQARLVEAYKQANAKAGKKVFVGTKIYRCVTLL